MATETEWWSGLCESFEALIAKAGWTLKYLPWEEMPSRYAGCVIPCEQEILVAESIGPRRRAPEDIAETLLHEYLHAVLPPWLCPESSIERLTRVTLSELTTKAIR